MSALQHALIVQYKNWVVSRAGNARLLIGICISFFEEQSANFQKKQGSALHLFALLAAVLLLASMSLALTACGSLLPSAEPLRGASKEHAERNPKGYLTVSASVALEPVKGVPQSVSDHLVWQLDAASRPAGLALLNYAGAEGDYRLQADLKALLQKDKVKIVYTWQAFDRVGARIGGISGTELVAATGADPWSSVTESALQAIAGQGIALVAGIAKAGPAVTREAAVPAAAAKSLGGLTKRVSAVSYSAVQPASFGDQIDAFEALSLVNGYRKSKGLRPLTLNSDLTAAASALAADMASHDRLSHLGPEGANLDKRLNAAGYTYLLAAENVGVGQWSLAELIGEWKRNPLESQNLLLPGAKQMGIAFRYRPDTTLKTFWTLVVASPPGAPEGRRIESELDLAGPRNQLGGKQ